MDTRRCSVCVQRVRPYANCVFPACVRDDLGLLPPVASGTKLAPFGLTSGPSYCRHSGLFSFVSLSSYDDEPRSASSMFVSLLPLSAIVANGWGPPCQQHRGTGATTPLLRRGALEKRYLLALRFPIRLRRRSTLTAVALWLFLFLLTTSVGTATL